MSRPVKSYKLGSVECAVWEKEFDGKKSYSFTFQKSYKDKDGKWNNSQFFTEPDIRCIGRLCDMVNDKAIKTRDTKAEVSDQSYNATGGEIPF